MALAFDKTNPALPVAENNICFQADAQGRILSFSSPLLFFLGGVPALSGATLVSFIALEEQDRATQLVQQALRGHPGSEYLRFKTGRASRIGLVTIMPVYEDGKTTGIYGFIKDATDRVEKTKLLYETDQKFEALFNNEKACVMIVGPDGHLLDINASGVTLLSCPNKNMAIGKPVSAFIHPEDRNAYMQLHHSCCQGESGSVRFRVLTPLDTIHWLENNAVPLRNKGGEIYAILVVAHDITRKIKKEEALRAAQERTDQYAAQLTGILDTIGDGFLATDRNWIVTFWNKKAAELLGRPMPEMIGKNLWAELPDDIPLSFHTEFNHALENDQPVHFEDVYHDTWFEVSAFPSASGLSVYFKNINDRRRQELALRISNERYQFITEATSDVIWDWNLDSSALYINNSFTRILGHDTSSGNMHRLWDEHLHPEDKLRVVQNQAEAIRNPDVFFWEDTYRFARANGSYAILKDRAVIIRNEDGRALRMIGSAQDVTKQHEVEAQIKRNERQFRAMVQSGIDIVLLLDGQFRVQYISENAFHQSGYSERELTGVLGYDSIHPDDLAAIFVEGQKILHKRSILLPLFRFRIRSGEYRWIEATLTNHLGDPDIAAILVNVRDITEKKNTEDDARMLSLVAERTVNAVVITGPSMDITWVNKAFCTITGYSFEEVKGKNPSFLQGAETDPATINYMRQCIAAQKAFSCEIINYAKSGERRWLEINAQPIFNEQGQLVQFFAIQTDITARKEIEQAIRLSEEKYKLLFYKSPIPKWIYRLSDLRFVEVNEAATAHYGYTREEFLKRAVTDIHPAEGREQLRKLSRPEKYANGERYYGKWVHLKKDGTEIQVETTTHGLELATGFHVIAEVADITEKIQLEQRVIEEKISAQKEIAKAIINTQEKERSEIGKELHDNVNQLLTTTKLYIENTRYYPDQSQAFIEKSMNLLQHSITEIRALSKALVTPTIYDIGFQATVEELIEHYRALKLFTIDFQFNASEELIEKGMKLTIYRILQELLNNCVKYANARHVSISILRAHRKLHVTFQDNGVGFDTRTRKKGLGLNNIRNRAEIFQGVLKIVSQPGLGCTTEIVFPHQ